MANSVVVTPSLKSTLASSKIQVDNNALYQTIIGLINDSTSIVNFINGLNFSALGTGNPDLTTLQDLLNVLINEINSINDNFVTGPASAIDGNEAIFSGTTGKIIRDDNIAARRFARHFMFL